MLAACASDPSQPSYSYVRHHGGCEPVTFEHLDGDGGRRAAEPGGAGQQAGLHHPPEGALPQGLLQHQVGELDLVGVTAWRGGRGDAARRGRAQAGGRGAVEGVTRDELVALQQAHG